MRPQDYAEQCFADAATEGAQALQAIKVALVYLDATIAGHWCDEAVETAVQHAMTAAMWFHEGLRHGGECPEHGETEHDPWGQPVHRERYICCGLESGEPDGEQITGAERASLERAQMAHVQRTLK